MRETRNRAAQKQQRTPLRKPRKSKTLMRNLSHSKQRVKACMAESSVAISTRGSCSTQTLSGAGWQVKNAGAESGAGAEKAGWVHAFKTKDIRVRCMHIEQVIVDIVQGFRFGKNFV